MVTKALGAICAAPVLSRDWVMKVPSTNPTTSAAATPRIQIGKCQRCEDAEAPVARA